MPAWLTPAERRPPCSDAARFDGVDDANRPSVASRTRSLLNMQQSRVDIGSRGERRGGSGKSARLHSVDKACAFGVRTGATSGPLCQKCSCRPKTRQNAAFSSAIDTTDGAQRAVCRFSQSSASRAGKRAELPVQIAAVDRINIMNRVANHRTGKL